MSMKKYSASDPYDYYGKYEIRDHYRDEIRYDPRQREMSFLMGRYGIKVTETKQQYERRALDVNSFNTALSDIHVSRETVITLEIKERNLERLAYNYLEMQRCTDEFGRIKTELNQEAQLRSKFPAVAKAYENYQMVLALMGHTKEKDK
jgi:hypothetical protein